MNLHHISGYIQNIFLVEYEHGCMLLDGACRADFPHIKTYFEKVLKRPFSDLKVVVVTHMHPDHAGCAHILRKATSCKIISGSFDKQWYSGFKGFVAHTVDIGLAYWVANRLKKPLSQLWYSPTLKPDLMLDDGQLVPEFEDWQIINTPGHTDRDISLVNQSEKLVYVADLIVKVKGKFASPFPVSFPNTYKRSLQRLYDFLGYSILMAHVPDAVISNTMVDELIEQSPSEARTSYRSFKAKLRRIARS